MPDGLLYAYLLDGKGGGRPMEWSEVEAWHAEQGVLWLHFDVRKEAAINWILNDSKLEGVVADAMVHEENRPRANAHGDGLLLSLRGVNMNPGADPEDMVSVRIWAEPTRIISTRRRRLLSVSDMVKWIDVGDGPDNPSQFILQLTERLIERMVDVVDITQDQVDALEERLLTEQGSGLRSELNVVRRQLVGLRRYLTPMREALSRLHTEKLSWFSMSDRLHLRELMDRLSRILEDLDMIRERSALVQEQIVNALSDQLNSRLYVLAIVSAIFLPLGFLTGLMGINVGGIPGADNPRAFTIFLGILLLVVIGQFIYFRSRKWV
jgi:zinc transporter